jgi:iron complex transport system substrate-binding protein
MCQSRTLTRVVAAIGLTLWFHPSALTQSPAKPPARIVSLIPATTEMLFAVGVGDRVVGVGSFDRFPPEVERIQRVGALLDPDVERILALRPDLVVVYRSQTDLLAQLARAQIPAFVYAHAGLADVTTTLRELGARVGAGDRANTLAADIERRIDATRKRHAGGRRPKTLIVMGRDALALRGIYASGGIGFLHDMLAAAGGENVFADTKRQAVQATSELILARAPEVILELRADPMDQATEAKELRVWGALASVPAVRNGRVHIIVDSRTVIPGPRVAEAVEVFERALHAR